MKPISHDMKLRGPIIDERLGDDVSISEVIQCKRQQDTHWQAYRNLLGSHIQLISVTTHGKKFTS